MNFGKIKTKGNKNRICLVMDKNTPLMDLPMEVKKVEVIGCKALNQVKNNMMRNALVPNSKYSGLPLPNNANNCLGMVWNKMKEQKEKQRENVLDARRELLPCCVVW